MSETFNTTCREKVDKQDVSIKPKCFNIALLRQICFDVTILVEKAFLLK